MKKSIDNIIKDVFPTDTKDFNDLEWDRFNQYRSNKKRRFIFFWVVDTVLFFSALYFVLNYNSHQSPNHKAILISNSENSFTVSSPQNSKQVDHSNSQVSNQNAEKNDIVQSNSLLNAFNQNKKLSVINEDSSNIFGFTVSQDVHQKKIIFESIAVNQHSVKFRNVHSDLSNFSALDKKHIPVSFLKKPSKITFKGLQVYGAFSSELMVYKPLQAAPVKTFGQWQAGCNGYIYHQRFIFSAGLGVLSTREQTRTVQLFDSSWEVKSPITYLRRDTSSGKMRLYNGEEIIHFDTSYTVKSEQNHHYYFLQIPFSAGYNIIKSKKILCHLFTGGCISVYMPKTYSAGNSYGMPVKSDMKKMLFIYSFETGVSSTYFLNPHWGIMLAAAYKLGSFSTSYPGSFMNGFNIKIGLDIKR